AVRINVGMVKKAAASEKSVNIHGKLVEGVTHNGNAVKDHRTYQQDGVKLVKQALGIGGFQQGNAAHQPGKPAQYNVDQLHKAVTVRRGGKNRIGLRRIVDKKVHHHHQRKGE